MPMSEKAWPSAPRPFHDETFGGWFGRVAGRYGITVDELAGAADLRLDLNPAGSGWLVADAPGEGSLRRLAALCRLAPEDVHVQSMPAPVRVEEITYCYRCLVLNPTDVFSPYWRRDWAGGSTSPCPAHDGWVGRLSPADMVQRRNLPRLLKMLERRWHRIERARSHRR
jgi:TniQ